MRYIKELLDFSFPYIVTFNNNDIFEAEFYTEAKEKITFEANTSSYGDEEWLVMFDREGELSLTNTNDEFLVLGTIAKIFKEFIEQRKPEKFYFTAKEKSRIKVYQLFANKIGKEFGYEYEVNIYSDGGVFNFKKS
jgi:hypothetical protein